MKALDGRVALATGAARGIGRALADAFSRRFDAVHGLGDSPGGRR